MIRYVVDASVAVKWFTPEPHSDDAMRVASATAERIAPDLLSLEVANVLWKQVQRGLLSQDGAHERLSGALIRVTLIASAPLIDAALSLAIRFGCTVYDATYLALALRHNCRLVTADRRLRDLVSDELSSSLLWITDVP